MRRVGATVAGALGIAIAFAMACGPDVPEKREQVEHRIVPCEIVCESMFDPECGDQHLTEVEFDDAAECAEMCADPDVGGNWTRIDGVDRCKSEYEAWADCLDAATCEEQSEFWNPSDVYDYPCREPAYALGNCYTIISLEEGEG